MLLSGITVTLDTNNAAELNEQQLAWGDIQLICLQNINFVFVSVIHKIHFLKKMTLKEKDISFSEWQRLINDKDQVN